MASKYLKGGALNPIWCDEQDAIAETEYIIDSINYLSNVFKGSNMDINMQLGEGVEVCVHNEPDYYYDDDEDDYDEDYDDNCTISENIYEAYEAKFRFIKDHSSTPEDLKLAREIVGLD